MGFESSDKLKKFEAPNMIPDVGPEEKQVPIVVPFAHPKTFAQIFIKYFDVLYATKR